MVNGGVHKINERCGNARGFAYYGSYAPLLQMTRDLYCAWWLAIEGVCWHCGVSHILTSRLLMTFVCMSADHNIRFAVRMLLFTGIQNTTTVIGKSEEYCRSCSAG